MKIQSLEINNWRSIRSLKAEINDLTVVIGQNNHGKSNILSALLFFFGKLKPDVQDFLVLNQESFIEIKFIDLDATDRVTFKKYLSPDSTIIVRKVLYPDLKFSYHGYTQTPQEEWLDSSKASNFTAREVLNGLPLKEFIPETGRITKAVVEQAQIEYIEAHQNELNFQYSLEESNFLGLKTVAQGIFGDIFFIPAVKSATDELNPKGTSVFSELYSKILNKLAESNDTYKSAKNQVATLVGILNKTNAQGEENTERPSELNVFEQDIAAELGNWNTKIEVEILPPNLDDIFKVGTQIWIDDGVKTDANRKGNGLQRALIFALIKAYSKIIRIENQPSEEGARQSSDSAYFIIEEPELYLHPQAQRELFLTLMTLSNNRNQVILSTHSSSFVDLENYKSLIIAQKNDIVAGTTIKQCSIDLFSGLEDKKRLNIVYWINPERSELFFAKKVILLEGQTEKTIIPFIAKKLSVFRNDYTLIDCGSKDNMPLYLKLLNGFKIHYVVVYDHDHQSHKNPEAIANADKSSLAIEKTIDSSLGSSVILENDIEEEIGLTDQTSKNKPYVALRLVSNEQYQVPTQLKTKITKLFE